MDELKEVDPAMFTEVLAKNLNCEVDMYIDLYNFVRNNFYKNSNGGGTLKITEQQSVYHILQLMEEFM